jgi:hypothetical protein
VSLSLLVYEEVVVDMTLFEIPAVVVVLSIVGVVVVRAFASSRVDAIDLFMRREMVNEREKS